MTKQSRKSVVKYCLTFLLLAALLFSGVYAWIVGDVVPAVSGTMRIGNEAGLSLELDGTQSSLIDLNANFGIETGGMRLTEVSSADGDTFFKRQTDVYYEDPYAEGEDKEIITYAVASSKQSDQSGNYVDVSVTMNLEYAETKANYYVYFLDGLLGYTDYIIGFTNTASGYSTDDGLKALRSAIIVQGIPEESINTTLFHKLPQAAGDSARYVALFGNAREDGTYDHPFKTKAVITTGVKALTTESEGKTVTIDEKVCGKYKDKNGTETLYGTMTDPAFGGSNIVINAFSDYAIGDHLNTIPLTGDTKPSDDYLFVLGNGIRTAQLTLRIWLEGGSAYCVDNEVIPTADDTKDSVRLKLYFVAFEETTAAAE